MARPPGGNARGGMVLDAVSTIPAADRDRIRQILASGTGPHRLDGDAAAILQRWLDPP